MLVRSLLALFGTVSAIALAGPVTAQSTISVQTGTQDAEFTSDVERQTRGDGVQLIIQPRIDNNAQASLDLQRFAEMEETVLLGLRTDPRLVPPARVIEMVESIGMVDDAGIRIVSGYELVKCRFLYMHVPASQTLALSINSLAPSLIVTKYDQSLQTREYNRTFSKRNMYSDFSGSEIVSVGPRPSSHTVASSKDVPGARFWPTSCSQ